jgi:hypothetical protein
MASGRVTVNCAADMDLGFTGAADLFHIALACADLQHSQRCVVAFVVWRCLGPARADKDQLASIKWFRQFENALRVGIPALRRMGIVMEIAAHPHESGPFGEREVAAHGWAGHVGVEFGQPDALLVDRPPAKT